MVKQYFRDGLRPVLLVVDDQPINIRALNEVFKDDFEVLMATNGASAIKKAKEYRPDVILLDIVMPDLDGYQVCKALTNDEATQDIPVIFVTAEDDSKVEAKGFAVGAVDFITKPFHPLIVKARVMTHLTLKLQMDWMRNMALRDGLTGLFNRRRFDEALENLWRLCQREQRPLSLLMIDVDFFKRFNDNYGHIVGDDCLKQVAQALLQACKRPGDLCCRYGGEEFACLLPFTDSEGAQACADEVLRQVQQLQIPHETSDAAKVVTVSIGISSIDASAPNSPSQLLLHADEALYQSKQNGRHRASLYRAEAAAE
ncbi:hypothetical protein HR45_08665 [Shewanella mangrovi]|uniref:diguanylate cyclase n=1 Tax=Shewanella mangrovi TaxID=1515746 RepID=A0A094LRV5_9GAMM|nr:hypothetical protein HR45_08665 [Shewanella mangrovi]